MSVGRCCCCNCTYDELWACHDGITYKVDDGSLYSWSVGCCATRDFVTQNPCVSTWIYQSDIACCTDHNCDTYGATVWLQVIGFEYDEANCCTIWEVEMAVTCNTISGTPVTPSSYATFFISLNCDGDFEYIDGGPFAWTTLGCIAPRYAPIAFANNSTIASCPCVAVPE